MVNSTQHTSFYQEFIMGRGNWKPEEFGVSDISKDNLVDQFADTFNDIYKGAWTVDELCVHPREAARFCDDVRRKYGYYHLPDDVVLRSLMNLRKKG